MRATALVLASALASGSSAIAQEPNARDIVDRVESRGRTVQGEYEMTITTPLPESLIRALSHI